MKYPSPFLTNRALPSRGKKFTRILPHLAEEHLQPYISGNNFCKSEVRAEADSLSLTPDLFSLTPDPLGTSCSPWPSPVFAGITLHSRYLPLYLSSHQNMILKAEAMPCPSWCFQGWGRTCTWRFSSSKCECGNN